MDTCEYYGNLNVLMIGKYLRKNANLQKIANDFIKLVQSYYQSDQGLYLEDILHTIQ